jgi:hypothetical protein
VKSKPLFFQCGRFARSFVWSGYVPLLVLRHATERSPDLVRMNGPILYHRNITPLDIVISRSGLLASATLFLDSNTGPITLPPPYHGLAFLKQMARLPHQPIVMILAGSN